MKTYSKKLNKSFNNLSQSEIQKLVNYDWPGNIRELENLIERAAVICNGSDFKIPESLSLPNNCLPSNHFLSLEENERRHIIWALKQTNWKVRGYGGAADLLSINPSTLSFRMKKLRIERPKGIIIRRSSHKKGGGPGKMDNVVS